MKRLLIIAILLLPSPCFAQCPEENLPPLIQLARMNVTVLGGGVAAAPAGNTISYVAYAEASAGAASLTVSKPTGTAEGDLMVAFFTDDTTGASITFTGWTLQANVAETTTHQLYCYTKTAGGEEPADYTWDPDGSARGLVGHIVTLRKTGGTWVVVDTVTASQDSSSQTITSGTITGTNDDLLLFAFGCDGNMNINTAPTDMTEISGILDAGVSQVIYRQEVDAGDTSKSLTWASFDQSTTIGIIIGLE